ncbi:very short patch repair endonuclease [Nonlabens spongiae]|uniref:Very short patch repair endonuclease n=1 Tax=Nonlabens spongiae TaxID=331648 RepID=A0A1W6MLT3_9FLAO|nr:very short patch repair endonuclease [Nonlabens spongiae]ARN78561.1 very short patch repair endonuclease [Nonlabens spongiae]
MTEYTPEEPIKVPKFSEEAGFYTTNQRSKQMSKIRGKDTKPEIKLRKALWAKGYRYRKDFKKLPGKPDIAMPIHKTVIFVDGEFWHGYDWENRKHNIKSNRDFWIPKIERNMQRDGEVNHLLEQKGYKVFRFWSKEILKNLDAVVQEIVAHIEFHK